jgi:energy-coupling factor transporter ATP-binding protein EcfA2
MSGIVPQEVERPPLTLPRPERVELRNFTLYQRRREVQADFPLGVFCLAGANGLGKSTFLAALNFAITGVVLPPAGGTRVLAPDDLYQDALGYSATHFDGRISAADHDLAEVELEMSVGRRRYTLVRGMFAPVGLRSLVIEDEDGAREDFSDTDIDEGERHARYEEALLQDTGLEAFSQLVFLQLLILTFDEQRRLLFFDDRVTQLALFIAFGVSAGRARAAEKLLRQVDKADSLMRNLQWQATGVRKQLEALIAAMDGTEPDDAGTAQEHKRLQQRADTAAEQFRRAQAASGDSAVVLANAASRLRAAQTEYEQLYVERLKTARRAADHPVVAQTLRDSVCAVCGAADEHVARVLRESLADSICPLCASELPESPTGDAGELAQLERVGEHIVELERALDDQRQAFDRHRDEVEAAEERLRGLHRSLEEFRQQNSLALARAAASGGMVEGATQGLQNQINSLLERKDEERKRRESAKRELKKLQGELIDAYSRVEDDFVPRFTDLAHRFLGVPLEVDLERRSTDVYLRLSLADSNRRAPDELSESQRFFVDIALRMALAQQMSSAESPACMYIDTPEGSLDIAYESRAGAMFGDFAGQGNQLIMTANINTSELLHNLASICGREQMTLMRMTEWTYLTDVQQGAEDLFDRAYGQIEEKLEGRG